MGGHKSTCKDYHIIMLKWYMNNMLLENCHDYFMVVKGSIVGTTKNMKKSLVKIMMKTQI